MRQSTEGNYFRRFFGGSLGPGLKNKDEIDDYFVYVPKYFDQAEKTDPKVARCFLWFLTRASSIRPVAAAIVNAIFDVSDIDGAYWPVPEEIDDAELPDVLD